jgi:hypothetical protein
MAKKSVRTTPWTVIAVLLLAVLAVGGGVLYAFYARRAGESQAGVPQLEVTPQTRDLGTIDYRDGIVTLSFTVENRGQGDLVITEMETSCGCTKASLIVNGREGPQFGMRGHGEWPRGWSARLKPGERAELKVTYDPLAHGIYVGPFDRLVFIYSNDPREPIKRVRFYGYQRGG